MKPHQEFAAPQGSISVLDQPNLIATSYVSRRLYQWGIAALIVSIAWFLQESTWRIDAQSMLGVSIFVISSIPALRWAKNNRIWIPIFEISILTCIPQYAIPLILGNQELRFYPEAIIIKSSIIVIMYILMGMIGFSFSSSRRKTSTWLTTSLIPREIINLIPLGIFFSNIYFYFAISLNLIPYDYVRPLGSLFTGIALLSVFVSARLWGSYRLNSFNKSFLVINIIIYVILWFSTLYLGTGFSMIILALISYSSARRNIPWPLLLIILPIISILHLGKGEMRQKYWYNERASHIGLKSEGRNLEDLPAYFSEWINYGISANRENQHLRRNPDSALNRASIIHLLCLAIERVPQEKNYLHGESYVAIPFLFIPRLIWPEKPGVQTTNDQLMIYLGLVNPDSINVSIAIGMLTESYLNFGIIGVAVLGLIFGFIFKQVSLLSQGAPQFSAIGIFAILLTASSFQVEQNTAGWLTTLFQLSIVCVGIPLALSILRSRAG